MAYNYSVAIKENCAKAMGVSLPVSHKKAILVCNFIRHKPVDKAKADANLEHRRAPRKKL